MKYRIAGANGDFNTLDAKELYQQVVKGDWKKVRGLPYRAVQLIEVYFKEAKQHLGFLKDQTWTFASHTASIHLSAIRYLTLLHAKRGDEERRVCDIRAQIKDQLTTLDFAQRLWQLFRALVSGTIDYKKALGRTAEIIMEAIDGRIEEFFLRRSSWMCLR